jgi:hypothetical protein
VGSAAPGTPPVSPRKSSFCFIAFLGVSQRWALKTTTKNFVQKNRVKKCAFTKKSTKQSKLFFFSVLFYHVFERFSARGVRKHHLKGINKYI